MEDDPTIYKNPWLRIRWLDAIAFGVAFNFEGLAFFFGPISIFVGQADDAAV